AGRWVLGKTVSARPFEYPVIRDNVNVASRLEGLNKLYGTQILVGPDTYAAAREKFWFRAIDRVRVRGRTGTLTVYELLARREEVGVDADWLAAFAEGLEAYWQGDWATATRAFGAAVARNSLDACAKFYLSHAEQLAKIGRAHV